MPARYLGLKNVVEANSVEYKISDIKITTSAEPDPEQYYFIELGKMQRRQGRTVSLTDAGLILGTIPQSIDTVVRTIVTGNRITSHASPKRMSSGDIQILCGCERFREGGYDHPKKVNIDTMTMERQYLKRTMVEKSPEQKAKEAADFISKIKDNRFNLISGYQEVNYNKETLEYMDTQLKILEKEYMKLFTGISIHKT